MTSKPLFRPGEPARLRYALHPWPMGATVSIVTIRRLTGGLLRYEVCGEAGRGWVNEEDLESAQGALEEIDGSPPPAVGGGRGAE